MAEKEESIVKTGEEKELKKELQRVVKKILEEDHYGIEVITEAKKILSRLEYLKLNKLGIFAEKFKCPISDEIMADPVVLDSGQTFDRPYIQKWLNEGNRTCPVSEQVLSHRNLIPNNLVRELISLWYEEHRILKPKIHQDVDKEASNEADQLYLNSLLKKMSPSSSHSDQKEAAKELRRLTKTSSSHREVFCEFPNAISKLLSPLSGGSKVEWDPELQEDLVKTILNLSFHKNNKILMAKNPEVLPVLIRSLKYGTPKTRRNAAGTLITLSAYHSNKYIIGNSGAPVPLLDLLREEHPMAMKNAAMAIYNLCIIDEIKEKFTKIGAVEVILDKIKGGLHVDELLGILALLSTHENAIDELGDIDTLRFLLRTIRRSSSELVKEKCAVILFNVCSDNLVLLMVIKTEEIKHHTLARLADSGTSTSRAKRKAISIYQELDKNFSTTDTS